MGLAYENLHGWLKSILNVGKYSSFLDCMGMILGDIFFSISGILDPASFQGLYYLLVLGRCIYSNQLRVFFGETWIWTDLEGFGWIKR